MLSGFQTKTSRGFFIISFDILLSPIANNGIDATPRMIEHIVKIAKSVQFVIYCGFEIIF